MTLTSGCTSSRPKESFMSGSSPASWQPSDAGGTQTDTSVVSFRDWLYRQLLQCVILQSGP